MGYTKVQDPKTPTSSVPIMEVGVYPLKAEKDIFVQATTLVQPFQCTRVSYDLELMDK